MIKSKVFALLFTGFVLTLLVLTGPVEGFTLNLDINKTKPTQGDIVTFTAQIDIEQSEHLPIEKLILELDGPEKLTCTFDRSGKILDDCEGITITKIQDPGYNYGYGYNFGYGYGFSKGVLKYKIELDTENLKLGEYSTLLKIKIGGEFFSQTGKNITVKNDDGGQTCTSEWTCSTWSPCIDGAQYRECYRNLNYCTLEEKPEESRTCLLEDGSNFQSEETILLNSINQENIEDENLMTFRFINNGFSDSGQFIIILLLMNCIIATINIILRVQKNRHRKIAKISYRKR